MSSPLETIITTILNWRGGQDSTGRYLVDYGHSPESLAAEINRAVAEDEEARGAVREVLSHTASCPISQGDPWCECNAIRNAFATAVLAALTTDPKGDDR